MSKEKGRKSGENEKERRATGAIMEKPTKSLFAHGDLDGIVSAALLGQGYGLSKVDTKLVFTQPFLLDSIEEIPETVQQIFVVDIAVNRRDPQMTKRFLKRVREKLVTWFDHHKGWSKELIGTLSQVVVDEEKPSTAEIIRDKIGGDSDLVDLVSDATVADTGKGKLGNRGRLIYDATKANLRDDSVRKSAVWWIVNGSKEDYRRLQVAQEKYQRIQEMTEELVKKCDIYNGVAVVDVRDMVGGDYDLTELLLEGEKISPTKTAIVLWKDPKGEEMITVATMRKINLVDLFDLTSGSPSRITLSSKERTLEEILETLFKSKIKSI